MPLCSPLLICAVGSFHTSCLLPFPYVFINFILFHWPILLIVCLEESFNGVKFTSSETCPLSYFVVMNVINCISFPLSLFADVGFVWHLSILLPIYSCVSLGVCPPWCDSLIMAPQTLQFQFYSCIACIFYRFIALQPIIFLCVGLTFHYYHHVSHYFIYLYSSTNMFI